MTKAPAIITYASVVSCETIRIALLMAALNDLNVKVGDVLNAYITAPISKKVWTVLGPEFGIDAGKSAIIMRTLYGLKSAGAAFRTHLASFKRQMGYTSCKTLTYGLRLRPDLLTTIGIMSTYFVMLTTFYASTTTLCLYSIRSMGTCR
jgi:hypothetical protein